MLPSQALAGYTVLVSVGSTVIGGQTNASITREMDTIDITSKNDSTDMFRQFLASWKTWSIDMDAFVILSDASLTDLEDAYMNGTVVDVSIKLGLGTTAPEYTGSALVTNMSIEASMDDATTFTITLTGVGSLSGSITPA